MDVDLVKFFGCIDPDMFIDRLSRRIGAKAHPADLRLSEYGGDA
ncbi:hypothetical protein PH586_04940 [Pseudomonas sp. SA3-5]|uniref:Uncharacterized protein n=1 Tax=Pseudomonas aestuarii TaxID=3018340 RepID=A0ABT4XC38_9PSED|nr:hypothetical protein [Pseudomonas aestuarii]MDA7085738.1 hypothetical protein [Pseudomonas aestuarii]